MPQFALEDEAALDEFLDVAQRLAGRRMCLATSLTQKRPSCSRPRRWRFIPQARGTDPRPTVCGGISEHHGAAQLRHANSQRRRGGGAHATGSNGSCPRACAAGDGQNMRILPILPSGDAGRPQPQPPAGSTSLATSRHDVAWKPKGGYPSRKMT